MPKGDFVTFDIDSAGRGGVGFLACVLMIMGSALTLAFVYRLVTLPTWPRVSAAHPVWLVLDGAVLLALLGGVLFEAAGRHGVWMAVLPLVLLAAMLFLPRSLFSDGSTFIPLSSLIAGGMAMAVALRAALVPGLRVMPLRASAFAVVLIVGTFLMAGLWDAFPFGNTTEEQHTRFLGYIQVYASSAALLSAPILLRTAGLSVQAWLTLPFALLSAAAITVDRQTLSPYIVFLVTGPLALVATIQALFASP
ncbi:hypothetical protein [Actinomadura rupiterrae]|uniref:hypothetical protein n=1 Tax=Actinomadura rupiterrae TaxID=559627 RepID=UPI0020A3473C|nr:hypothetical protein [Actinomadura rupiterrae]MCP2334815.1 hypothetical protein [Actinomadura rupiterrae]